MSVKPFKPRRILKSKAASLNPVLEAGEFIVEVPDTGVGTGPCRMKMGDGTSTYDQLPYMDKEVAVDVAASTIAFTESETTENADLLSEIVTGKSVKNLFGSTKKLLSNLTGSVTELNNKYESFNLAKGTIINSALGKALGLVTNSTITTVADKINEVINRGNLDWSGSNTTYTVPIGFYTGGVLDSRTSYNNGRTQGQNDVKNTPSSYFTVSKLSYTSKGTDSNTNKQKFNIAANTGTQYILATCVSRGNTPASTLGHSVTTTNGSVENYQQMCAITNGACVKVLKLTKKNKASASTVTITANRTDCYINLLVIKTI